MTELRGLLFDKDGTLFDFAATWSGVTEATLDALAPSPAARSEMAALAGYDPASGRFRPGSSIVAGSVEDTATLWAPFVGRPIAEIAETIDRLSEATLAPSGLVPAVDDLPGFLDGLLEAGYALGVATHDSEGAARAQLSAIGALDRFAFVAGYDSGHGLKPGPGMARAFSAATGLAPATMAMIGDSVHDLMVARNARLALAVGVLTGPANATELSAHADIVLPSIGHLPDALRHHS